MQDVLNKLTQIQNELNSLRNQINLLSQDTSNHFKTLDKRMTSKLNTLQEDLVKEISNKIDGTS